METNQTSQAIAGNGNAAGGGTDSHESSQYLHSDSVYLNDKAEHAPSFAPSATRAIEAPWPPLFATCRNDTLIFSALSHFDKPVTISAEEAAALGMGLQSICHNLAHRAGWWTRPDGSSITDNPYCFSNKLMLVVSELSEAMEGDRKGIKDDKLPHRDMREVELADAVIRIFDLAGAYNMDLGGAIAEKLHFNQQRADHKPENRVKAGGKAY